MKVKGYKTPLGEKYIKDNSDKKDFFGFLLVSIEIAILCVVLGIQIIKCLKGM